MSDPVPPAFREITFASAEYQQACALRNELLRRPLGLNLLQEDLSSESKQRHFGLFDSLQSLVACVVVAHDSSGEAKIRQMAVRQDQQGKGLGRALLEQVEARLQEAGLSRAFLHARLPAVAFYEKLGYRRTGAEFMEIGLPHVRMQKQLAP